MSPDQGLKKQSVGFREVDQWPPENLDFTYQKKKKVAKSNVATFGICLETLNKVSNKLFMF